MNEKYPGEIELANGETVEIPRPDKVFPTFAAIDGSSDAYIEDGRFRIRDESDAEISLAGASSDLDLDTIDGPAATIHADHETGDGADVYAEMALHDVNAVRELRDSLNLLLKYWGEYE